MKLTLIFFLTVFGLLAGQVLAGQKPVRPELLIYADQKASLDAEGALKQFHSGHFKILKNSKLNLGFTRAVYWMLLKMPAGADSNYLVIGNAHINKIEFYKIENGKPQFSYLTGDHFRFKQRPVSYRLFVFPLKVRSTEPLDLYLLRIDKRNESLQLSAEVLPVIEFYKRNAQYNLISGILWGIALLLISFGLFLFVNFKDKLYLFYVINISLMCLWLMSDKGFGYQYLWHDFTFIATRARAILACISICSFLHFMQAFIGQSRKSIFFKPIKWIKIFFSTMALSFLTPVDYTQYGSIVRILLIVHTIVCGLSFLLCIFSVVEEIFKKNRQAWFYLLSVVGLLIFNGAEIMIHMGSEGIPDSYFSQFGIQTGIIFESLILTFGLAYRFNNYRKDREELLITVNRKQQELTASIVETQENERKKISDQLHDEVGAMLFIASLQVSTVLSDEFTMPKNKALLIKTDDVLKSVSQTVRNLSHTITPWAIEKYGLNKAIQELIKNINLSQKITIESTVVGFETTSDSYPIHFLNDVYRIIQEMLNNILKHSNAQNAYLELVEHEDMITLIIEDNGVGLNEDEHVSGKGLDSIRARITYYKGQFEMKSKPDSGTIGVIELPRPFAVKELVT